MFPKALTEQGGFCRQSRIPRSPGNEDMGCPPGLVQPQRLTPTVTEAPPAPENQDQIAPLPVSSSEKKSSSSSRTVSKERGRFQLYNSCWTISQGISDMRIPPSPVLLDALSLHHDRGEYTPAGYPQVSSCESTFCRYCPV